MYTYHYARHHASESRKYDTLDAALDSAAGDLEFEGAWPKRIETDAGEVVLEGDALIDKLHEIAHTWYKPESDQ